MATNESDLWTISVLGTQMNPEVRSRLQSISGILSQFEQRNAVRFPRLHSLSLNQSSVDQWALQTIGILFQSLGQQDTAAKDDISDIGQLIEQMLILFSIIEIWPTRIRIESVVSGPDYLQ